MKKRIFSLLVLMIVLFIFTGCGNNADDSTVNDVNVDTNTEDIKSEESATITVDETMSMIENASEIIVKEAFVSLGKKKYNVLIVENDEEIKVAQITGKYVSVTGDVFTMKDLDGNIMFSEKQMKRWNMKLNRAAVIYDKDENVIGYIGEETDKLLSIGFLFHIYDANQIEKGISDQVNFSLTKKNKFYNEGSEEVAYDVEKSFISTSDKYTIKVNDSSIISPIEVIFATAIEDSIRDAKEEKEKKKKKKKKSS